MINIEHINNLIKVTILGEFNLDDFKEFQENVHYKSQFSGEVNLLIDMQNMLLQTIDVAIAEIKLGMDNQQNFSKIALVTDSQWISWSAWIEQFFSNASIASFRELPAAIAWLEASDSKTSKRT